MNIVIVGAGLGGLAAAIAVKTASPAHRVRVVESAPQLAEVGAGLQLTPNSTRLLRRWGLGDTLDKLAASPEIFTISRYTGRKILGRRNDFGREMLSKYGSPFCDIHRADLQLVMFERAKQLGVKFMFDARVTRYDWETPTATLSNGTQVTGDLIIAADGLWSKARAEFLANENPPFRTGDLAYRIVLKTDEIQDEDMKEFVSTPRVHMWVGPDSHAIYYPLRNNTMVNIVLLAPDNLPDKVAKASGDVEEMRKLFRDWDPLLQRFLALVPSVVKWRLMNNAEMDSWCNEKGTVAFLGDSCHPMLPYMAQGANSAVEDGAVLGGILAKIVHKSELPAALKTYQDLRKPRSWAMVEGSMQQRHWNHLRDGPEQEQRDQLLEEQLDEPRPGYPFYWLDPKLQSWVYSYDADKEVEKAWNGLIQTQKQ